MQQITKKELLKVLDGYLEKNVMLETSGYVDLKIVFEKFEYKTDIDQLCLKSSINENYVIVNFNNVNFMGMENNRIVFNIDDRKRYSNYNRSLREKNKLNNKEIKDK